MTRGVAPAALGLEVLVGRTGRENVATKAIRYLVEGRIMIRSVGPQGVRAHARGQGHVYNVAYEGGAGWSCSCPARTPKCCHIVATQLVVAVPH